HQNGRAMVPTASTHTALSAWATVELQAARSTAVDPPSGIQTVSRVRDKPCPGRIASSASMPAPTGSAVRWVTGVASGNRCSMSARMAAFRSDIVQLVAPNIDRKQEKSQLHLQRAIESELNWCKR